MNLGPHLFKTGQPHHRPLALADGIVLVGLGIFVYAGLRLALRAPITVLAPEMSLPHIGINDLAGLLEHLSAGPGKRHDIYRLTADLKADSDQLLGLMETAELLGFATIAEGDITLTPLGETFAEASILARKEIFATRIRRLPIFRWLLAMLNPAERRQLGAGVVKTALELEFPPQEAERQLDTIINWGRYAEILAYDDSSETLFLEQEASTPRRALAPGGKASLH